MDVLARTGQTQIQYLAIIRQCVEWYEALAEEWHISKEAMDSALQDYAWVSVRITPDDKKHRKLFAQGSDSADEVKGKFLDYAALPGAVISRWENAIREFDRPANEDTAPEASTDDPQS